MYVSGACERGGPLDRIRPRDRPSKLGHLKGELLRSREGGRSGERVIEPGPEVPASEELELEERHQVGQGPAKVDRSFRYWDQERDERGPELDVKRIGLVPTKVLIFRRRFKT